MKVLPLPIVALGWITVVSSFATERPFQTCPTKALPYSRKMACFVQSPNGEPDSSPEDIVSDSETTEEPFLPILNLTSANSNKLNTALQLRREQSATGEPASARFENTFHDFSIAALVGSLTGLLVALFKLSIEALRGFLYGQSFLTLNDFLPALVPAFGGVAVGLLWLLGGGPFSSGLRGTVQQVDSQKPKLPWKKRSKKALQSLRNAAAAVFTLGSGCSLGPEGPCVEIGLSVARSCIDTKPREPSRRKGSNRRLLSCGAAAGVAAGFNAPIAGVFFALEIMQNTFDSFDEATVAQADSSKNTSGDDSNSVSSPDTAVLSGTERITPILVASVLSALVARTLLGSHFVLQLANYSLKTPLLELPLYLALGAISGCVAFMFSEAAKFSKSLFDGKVGPQPLRDSLKSTPGYIKPIVGGVFCGLVGLFYPQILFFGYETLNSLLANKGLSTQLLLSLLGIKTLTTAFSAGSGLVGGTFAPALFLGAMTGASFHNIFTFLFDNVLNLQAAFGPLPGMADVPAYAMIGAASVLAALFRAPLTASMVLFELTRDYEVLLPLMASAGLGSLVGDILDDKFEQARARRRDQDEVSWGDLSSRSSLQKAAAAEE